MSQNLVLHHLAFHYLGVDGEARGRVWSRLGRRWQDPAKLEPKVRDHLASAIQTLLDSRPGYRTTYSGRFAPGPLELDNAEPGQALFQVFAHALCRRVWEAPGGDGARQSFLALSRMLADRLVSCASAWPRTLPGLLLAADFSPPGSARRHLALLKMGHVSDHVIKILLDPDVELRGLEVAMRLTDEIHKGVVWPHPDSEAGDLKLIDKYARARPPARYFTEAFLGCTTDEPEAVKAGKVVKLPERVAVLVEGRVDRRKVAAYVRKLEEATKPDADKVEAVVRAVIPDAAPGEIKKALEERLGDSLGKMTAGEVESEVEKVAEAKSWRIPPDRRRELRQGLLDLTALDKEKLKPILRESGVVEGASEAALDRAVDAEIESRKVSREPLLGKTLYYYFEVPATAGGGKLTTVTVSGSPEPMGRFLREEDGELVFEVRAPGERFRQEYK